MGQYLTLLGERRGMTGAAQPVVGSVEPQPAALMSADARDALCAAVDATDEANDGAEIERVHRALGDVGAGGHPLPCAVGRDQIPCLVGVVTRVAAAEEPVNGYR